MNCDKFKAYMYFTLWITIFILAFTLAIIGGEIPNIFAIILFVTAGLMTFLLPNVIDRIVSQGRVQPDSRI